MNDQDLSAFPTDDVHGYIELGRRLVNAAIFVGAVVGGCVVIYVAWRLANG